MPDSCNQACSGIGRGSYEKEKITHCYIRFYSGVILRKPNFLVRASVEKESEETEFEDEPARTFYTGRLMSWYSVEEVEVHPRCFYYSSVTSSISNNLGGSVDPVFPFPSLTESQMMNYMTGCSLFFHHGHGGVGYIQIGQSIVSELKCL